MTTTTAPIPPATRGQTFPVETLTDGTLALAVSNDFASQHIRDKHRDTIHAWVETSEQVDQVAIVVDPSLTLPERSVKYLA